jgi:exodeoxyribonuclease V alpha subunit
LPPTFGPRANVLALRPVRWAPMKTEPQPSDREVLAGLVERVTYQNAENGFCVIRVKARGHRDLVTVVGHAAVITVGEFR